jgi:tRNA(Arg) A34 adenosine deaminase TadA
MSSENRFMSACIKAARECASPTAYALAACVVSDDRILSLKTSSLIDSSDPSAHPEMEAVRDAARRTGSKYLPGAFLYSTLEPCPMCVSVAIWARMSGVVFGASQADALAWARAHPDPLKTWRQIRLRAATLARRGDPAIRVRGGVLRNECLALFSL